MKTLAKYHARQSLCNWRQKYIYILIGPLVLRNWRGKRTQSSVHFYLFPQVILHAIPPLTLTASTSKFGRIAFQCKLHHCL